MINTEKDQPEIPIKLPGVFCVVFDGHGDKFPIVQHNYGELDPNGENKWSLPGGGVECDEAFPITGIRETQEETGLKTKVVSLLAVLPYTKSRGVIILYESTVIGGILKPEDDKEIKDVKLVSLEEARRMFRRSQIYPAQFKLILIAHQISMGEVAYTWPRVD